MSALEESKPQETVLTASEVRRQNIRNQVKNIREHGQVFLSEGYKVLWALVKIGATGATELYHVARDSGICKRNKD